MTADPRPLFERYIIQYGSRARSFSSDTAAAHSLPPPPRFRKLSSPVVGLFTPSSRSPRPETTPPPMQQPPVLRDPFNATIQPDVVPTTIPTVRIDPEHGGSGKAGVGDVYSGSNLSLGSYTDMFHKEADVTISAVTHQSSEPLASQSLDIPDDVSVEDYSDLLYPELNSKRHAYNIHRPPMRKSIPSFTNHEGPESSTHLHTSPPLRHVSEERSLSKVDRLLGLDSRSSSRKGSTDRLMSAEKTRRDSFIEFDMAPQILAVLNDSPPRSSISDEIPSFAVPRLHGSMSTQGDYMALVEAVDSKKGKPDTFQNSKPYQVLVDRSDGRPSTQNLLDQNERAELVRKNKKIAQVLGPGAVPAAQTKILQAANGTNGDAVGLRRDALHRSARSEVVGVDDPKWDAAHDQKARDAAARLEHKSSWAALNHDTIFMTGTGRRHSSPVVDNFSLQDPESAVNWDAASMSSLGSIIETGGIADWKKNTDRPKSPTSFMELSDDDGVKTPRRLPSIDTMASKSEPGRRSLERIASPSLKTSPPSTSDQESRQSRRSIDSEETHISSIISRRTKRKDTTRSKGSSASYLSLSDDEIDRFDGRWKGDPKSDTWRMDRQRKREKLAKIHRYLGSKVPADLVLGYSSSTSPPPITSSPATKPPVMSKAQKPRHLDVDVERPGNGVKARKGIRRSSSAGMHRPWESGGRVTEGKVRSKDSLTESERLQEIKRAQKIEQIFGEKPPRRNSITWPSSVPIRGPSSPPKPLTHRSNSTGIDQPVFPKRKKERWTPGPWEGRPSTSVSSRHSTSRSTTSLIASYNKDVEREQKERVVTGLAEDDINFAQTIQIPEAYFPVGTASGNPWEDLYDSDVLRHSMTIQNGNAPITPTGRASRQFVDYRNSLNTLGRILDQDDRQSLNELHAVLDSDDEEADIENVDPNSFPALRSSTHDTRDLTYDKGLQPRASLSSINSVATNSTFQTLTPEPMAFQARRKRAAKLTHFFGATYRDLFGEVLDRIERGMLEEARHGEMSQDEMKHLMKQLERLKRRQSQLA